ncbi:dipeptide epimerase [Synechococcus sp. KORDI-52]|uniref:dipeptide epimerase n=1 Tax=Synechococcus sp. KORDI-52 TaxID=585425 RepID=UPI00056E2FB8|nr:dipeptide epimerase [Synechococcus sp. KORDI-52]
MGWALRRFSLTKAVPLTISRGTTAAVVRLELRLERDGLTGRGETGGFETGHRAFALEAVEQELLALLPHLEVLDPDRPQRFEPLLEPLSPPARCAVDLALWDWYGQRLAQPLWRLWGLDAADGLATSVTLGLASVPAALNRLDRWWRQLPATRVKLKLGSPDGLDHDRSLLNAVAQAITERSQTQGVAIELQVDANGGWTLDQARRMLEPLASHQVVLLEQPLAPDLDPTQDTAGFAALHPHCPMPLVADESCWDLEDLLRLAPVVDGVNLKLLKTGGLSQALLMARLAQRKGLDLMVGCYSDSSLLNGAAAQLLPLIRWPDLDSHLNLMDDPFVGLGLKDDRLRPSAAAGLGIRQAGGTAT